MSCRSPKKVIVVKREQALLAAHGERITIGPGYRSADRFDRDPSSVTLRDLIQRKGEGS